jgi:hypothetical protein
LSRRVIRPTWPIGRRARQAVLTVHLISSLGWIGADLGLLVLAITASANGTPRVGQGACVALAFLATWITAPVSVIALISGVLLSMATKWGVFRYTWVVVSLVLNALMVLLVVFALGPLYRGAEHLVLAAPATSPVADILGGRRFELMAPPCVAFVVLTGVTIINVYKPWGRFGWPRRR